MPMENMSPLALMTVWSISQTFSCPTPILETFPVAFMIVLIMFLRCWLLLNRFSMSGKVVVHHLYSNEMAEYEYNGPIGSVALEPLYPKSDKRELVCGGKTEKLVLNTKGWFGRKNEVLHAGEGPIHAVKWRGSLIAWANNLGVKMYDCNTEERIAYIDRTKFVRL